MRILNVNLDRDADSFFQLVTETYGIATLIAAEVCYRKHNVQGNEIETEKQLLDMCRTVCFSVRRGCDGRDKTRKAQHDEFSRV
eukprot:759851-Hanusia_phi.AAC.3